MVHWDWYAILTNTTLIFNKKQPLMKKQFTQFIHLKIALVLLLFFGMGTQLSAQDVTCFADIVIDNEITTCGSSPGFDDPANGLGAPNNTNSSTPGEFYSLGDINSYVIYGFTDNALVNDGTTNFDLTIYEIGPAVEQTDIYLLPSNPATKAFLDAIPLTPDSDGFYFFTNVPGSTTNVDIDAISPGMAAGTLVFNQVKIVNPIAANCNNVPGPDIDAVCALGNLPCDDIDNDGDGFTECGGDCDDNDDTVYPGAIDICDDGVDNNCNGIVDADFALPLPTITLQDAELCISDDLVFTINGVPGAQYSYAPNANSPLVSGIADANGELTITHPGPQPFNGGLNSVRVLSHQLNGCLTLGINVTEPYTIYDPNPVAPSLSVSSNTLCEGMMLTICVTGEPNSTYGVTEDGDISPFAGAIFRTDDMGSDCQTFSLLGPGEGTFNLVSFCEGDCDDDSCIIWYTDISEEVVVNPAPVQPEAVNCWDDFQLDVETCTYVNQGTQPVEPTTDCGEITTFDDVACMWDVTPQDRTLLITGDLNQDCDNEACFTFTYNSPVNNEDVTVNFDVSGNAGAGFPTSLNLTAEDLVGTFNGLSTYEKTLCKTFDPNQVPGVPGANNQFVILSNLSVTTPNGCDVTIGDVDNDDFEISNGINSLFNIEVITDVSEVNCGDDVTFTIASTRDPNSMITYEVNGVSNTVPFGTPAQDPDGDGLFELVVTVPNVSAQTTLELINQTDLTLSCDKVFNGAGLHVKTVDVVLPPMPALDCNSSVVFNEATCMWDVTPEDRTLIITGDLNQDCDNEACFTFTYNSPVNDEDVTVNFDVSGNAGAGFPTSLNLTAEDLVGTFNGLSTYEKTLCKTFDPNQVPGVPGANNQFVILSNLSVTTPNGCDVTIGDVDNDDFEISNGINSLFNIEVITDVSEVNCGDDVTFTIASTRDPNSMITYEVNGVSNTVPFGTPAQDPDGDGLFELVVTVPNVSSQTTLELINQTDLTLSCDKVFNGAGLHVKTVDVVLPEMPAMVNCWDEFIFDDATCTYVNVGTEPQEPAAANCWDDYQLDTESCTYVNMGTQPEMPATVNCWDDYQFDTDICDWVNVGGDVTDGGHISGDEALCGSTNDPSNITSNADASGSGAIEYLWLMNTTTATPPTTNNMNGWEMIPNSDSPTYDPGPISQTTWYLRCARPVGCTFYNGESNIIEKTYDPSCYCPSYGESTDYEWIESISVNGNANQSGADTGGYGDYTNIVLPISTGNNSINLTPGFSGNNYYEYWTVYIDYDQSGSFEYSELAYYNASGYSISGNFNVPLDALTGETRMRISMRYGNWPYPCNSFAEGEVEDYTVNITFCDNITNGGHIGDDEVLCNGNTDPAEMTSHTDASGGSGGDIEYLWLMNTTTSTPPSSWNMNGWVEIPNSNSPSYDPGPITETTWYLRCARRNGCGTYSGESNIIEKKVQSSCVEYCESGGDDTWYEWIEGIWLNDIDNTSGNNGGYADFTGISTDLQQGHYYTFTGSPGYNNCYEREYWRLWIDWNQDGDFNDQGELLFNRRRYGSFSKTIYVPANAMLGETRMRVSMKYGGWPQACQEFAYGETEDYTINVTGSGGSRQAPVTVFHAEKDELQSELWWVNNHGSQIESFELERSADGINFETIKSETEVVESNDMTRYVHMDTQPMKGDNHYRVLVKYDNGDEKYTEVRILNFGDIGNYGVYPNPADEYVMLNLADFVDGAADIKIIDAYGKTRYQQRIDLITTEAVRIDLKDFIDGVYFINVVVEGKRMVSKKLMINKLYGWR